MPPFHLSKWYLDVVAPDGRCAIAYAARLRLGPVTLHAQSLLRSGPDGVTSRWSVLPGRPPRRDEGGVRFACRALGLVARLAPLDPPHAARLHTAPGGHLDWRCLAPRAEAEWILDGEALRGLGYVEQLVMTLPPWELPIHELRWGRLLSPAGGVTWVDWRGPSELTLLLRDGRPVEGRVGDRAVTAAGATHRLQRATTLRDAPLARTARSLPPAVRRLLPRPLLALEETKWLSRGEVAGAPGFAIHEVVRWP